MPGLLKIGYTETSLDQRLSQLRHTAVPAHFAIEAAFRVDAPKSCERAIHEVLREFRDSPEREFFKINLKMALAKSWSIIQSHLAGEGQTEADPKPAPHPFPDLSETEEEILWSIIDKPTFLATDWSWIRNKHHFTDNETRYHLQEMKAKGYLKELKDRNPQYDSTWDLAEKGLKYYMWIEGREK